MIFPKILRACIFALLLVVFTPMAFSVDISTCQTLSANTEYNLTTSIVTSADCMVFGGDNITFNGQGFTLDAGNSGEALTTNNNARTNITIRNVNIVDFDEGIRLRNSRNILVENVNFSSVRDQSIRCDFSGTNEEGCYNATFRNIISDASDRADAILISRGRNLTFDQITVTNGGNGNGDDGIQIQNSSNIRITNYYTEFIRDIGIRLENFIYNVSIENVTINETRQGSGDAIYFNNVGDNITIKNLTGLDLYGDGINFNVNFTNILVEDVNLTNTRVRGIYCEGGVNSSCINGIFRNITMVNLTTNDGIYVDEGGNLTFENINISNIGTNDEGIQLLRVNDTSVTNVQIDGASTESITVGAMSYDLVFENINISNGGGEGLEFSASDYNNTIMRNIRIENMTTDGIRGTTRMRHSILENIYIKNITGGDGISITTNVSNTTFRNIYIENVLTFGIQCDDGNYNGCMNSTVENVTINGTQTNDAIIFDYSSNVTFRNISVYNIGDSAGDQAFFIRNGSNMIVDGFYGENLSDGMDFNSNSFNVNLSNIELYELGNAGDGIFFGANTANKRLVNITINEVRGGNGIRTTSVTSPVELYMKNITINDTDLDGLNLVNEDNAYLEDISVNASIGPTPTGSQGIIFGTDSDNITMINVNSTYNGDIGIRIDGGNLTMINIISSNNGDDGMFKDNDDANFTIINGTFNNNVGRGIFVDDDIIRISFTNISINVSGEEGIFLENRNDNSSFNNVTVNTSAVGFDGVRIVDSDNSNFSNMEVYGSGSDGIDIQNSENVIFENINITFSQLDGLYMNNNDNSIVRNVLSRFNVGNGLENTGSSNVNFTLLDLRDNDDPSLRLAGAHEQSRFALSYLENTGNISSSSFATTSFWNVTGTFDYSLGNFWDDLVCTAARIGEYLGIEYYTCVTDDYTIDVANNRIDFGPLVEQNATNIISLINPTPVNNSLICDASVVINTSTEGILEKSSFIDFNRTVVAYINFENTSGTQVTDLSSYNNTGTAVGSPQVNRSNRIRGSYYEFGDNGSYINLGVANEYDLQSNFTVGAWIRPSSSGPADYQTILNKEDAVGASGDRNLWLSLWGAATIGSANFRFSSSLLATDCDVNGGVDLRDGNWHHVLGQYNGTHCSLYVNGAQVGTDPVLGVPEGVGDPLWIGEEVGTAGRGFDGAIDEVLIVSRSLNDTEISALYNGSANTLYSEIHNLEIGNYTYEACSINVNGTYTCSEERHLQRGNQSPAITINSPVNNSKFFSPEIVVYNITAASAISNVTYYLNGNSAVNYTMVSDDNLTWVANGSILPSGTYNITYQYDGGCGILETVDGGEFSYLLNRSLEVRKEISSSSLNMYLIELVVENYDTNTTNVTLYDYVDTPDFAYGSFTTIYSFVNTTDGGEFNGTILGWNLSLPPQSSTSINYSIVSSNATNYMVSNNHIFGIE